MIDMKNVVMWAYNNNSEGATAVATALGIKKIRHENSTFAFTPLTLCINWGSSSMPDKAYCGNWLNHPQFVDVSCNKLKTFKALQGACPIPEWTTDPKIAKGWGDVVIARKYLKGKDGDGIVVVEKGLDIPEAKCYTRYIDKDKEFRVHVIGGKVVDVVRKISQAAKPPLDWRIRTGANNFVFKRNGIDYPQSILDVSISAVAALGLDFGGVDVVSKGKDAWVLEVNTAPEMLPYITNVYAETLKKTYLGG